jgi:hypothetical protein
VKHQIRSAVAKAALFAWLAGFAWTPLVDAQKFSDWGPPVNLGPFVNSKYNEQRPAISRNNLSLYFISDNPNGFGSFDIWVSHRTSVDTPWGTPQNLGPNINTSGYESAPTFSPDGHWLFFGSNRPGGCGGFDIYASHRKDVDDDFAWEPPINLGCEINSPQDDDGPTLLVDKEEDTTLLYFTSLNRPGNIGDWDIYVSKMKEDGTFGPGVLVPELSSPFRDTRTAIRRDGLEIFITSARPGKEGAPGPLCCDLWVSTRKDTEDSWSLPVNLGPVVNSTANNGSPALSRDGTTLYFNSDRPGGFGANDLYVTTRTRLRGDQDGDNHRDHEDH